MSHALVLTLALSLLLSLAGRFPGFFISTRFYILVWAGVNETRPTTYSDQSLIEPLRESSPMSSLPKLFQPITVGDCQLNTRIVHAPMTRWRAYDDHTPVDLVIKYYEQRASYPGTLLITEATFISAPAGGFDNCPGIYTDLQIAQWKKVTAAVHAKGSYIFLQIWALGRGADPASLEKDGISSFVAPSPIPLKQPFYPGGAPRELTIDEIRQYVAWYAEAASIAVHQAGFDGVEIHGANGFLIDQFVQDLTNQRTDHYGGSIENRSRFPLEVIQAVVDAVGETKVGYRMSPWSEYQEMSMADPVPQFSHLVKNMRDRFPRLAYLHVVEEHMHGTDRRIRAGASNQFLRDIWGRDRRYIASAGFDREKGIEMAESQGVLVAYGRLFMANPDLVLRLKNDWPLNKDIRERWYVKASQEEDGYTDYPFYRELSRLNIV